MLVSRLGELADWAESEIWDVPIDLPDKLRQAAEVLKYKEAQIIYEYPFVQKNPMFAVGYCDRCGYPVSTGEWHYCPGCGAYFIRSIKASCQNCKHRCKNQEENNCLEYEIKLVLDKI